MPILPYGKIGFFIGKKGKKMKLKDQTPLNAFVENLIERIQSLRWLVKEAFDFVCLDISQILVEVYVDFMRRAGFVRRLGGGIASKIWDYFLFKMGIKYELAKIKNGNQNYTKNIYRMGRRC